MQLWYKTHMLSMVTLCAGSALLAVVAMEAWAAALHRYVWHSWLWPLHRSHHASPARRRPAAAAAASQEAGWQANDWLSLLHLPPALALIVVHCGGEATAGRAIGLGLGLGMSVFGCAYLLVHDGFVHGRLPVESLARLRFMRRLRAAHCLHHQSGGAPYGLFSGPWVLDRARRRTGSTGRCAFLPQLGWWGRAVTHARTNKST